MVWAPKLLPTATASVALALLSLSIDGRARVGPVVACAASVTSSVAGVGIYPSVAAAMVATAMPLVYASVGGDDDFDEDVVDEEDEDILYADEEPPVEEVQKEAPAIGQEEKEKEMEKEEKTSSSKPFVTEADVREKDEKAAAIVDAEALTLADFKAMDLERIGRRMFTKYIAECFGLFLFWLYLIMYCIGSAQNKSVADAWLDTFKDVVVQQFSEVGVYSEEDANEGKAAAAVVVKEDKDKKKGSSWMSASIPSSDARPLLRTCGSAQFKLYATGRRNVRGAIFCLETLPRQDMVTRITNVVLGPASGPGYSSDQLCVELALDETVLLDNFVFAIFRRSEYKRAHSGFPDLKDFAKVSPSLCVLLSLCECIFVR